MKKVIKNVMQSVIIIFLSVIPVMPVCADGTHPRGISLDGSVGNAGKLDLPGPNYEIKPEYGQQAGANLFHSFHRFNIHSDQSATFSGPDSVQNVISRVTGGDASWIDGTLRSTIPGADMYLLNPAGVMFGQNAALDLGGSFHVSTADYLRMGENDRFYTVPHVNDVLSVAAPAAFGFLDADVGKISVEGMGELTKEVWGEEEYKSWGDWRRKNPDFFPGLVVPEGESISMIGGDVEISGTYYYLESEDASYNVPVGSSLNAPEGRVNLAALRDEGEVKITDSGLDMPAGETGDITLSDGSRITVTGNEDEEFGAGSVFIRGGRFVMDGGAEILSQPGHEDGQVIDIQADHISLKGNSEINANTYGKGNGTDIQINASEEVIIVDGKIRNSSSYIGDDPGDGGTLSIQTKILGVSGNEAWLGGESISGSGRGGDTTIHASESVHVSDKARISTSAQKDSTGQAGDITINTPSLLLNTKAVIESGSMGKGEGGNIAIHTGNLKVMSGGKISVRTEQTGSGGSLAISGADPESHEDFADSVTLTGAESVIRADTTGRSDAGRISITARKLSLTEDASIVTSSSDRGNAGDITLNLESLDLSKGASVASASEYPVANIYSIATIPDLDGLTDSAQEGDIAIVEDAGTGNYGTFIRTGTQEPWIQITEKVTRVQDMAPLNDLMATLRIGPGEVFIVEDMGDGTSGAFVHEKLVVWTQIRNIYALSDLAQRDRFISLPGDIAQSDAGGGTVRNFVYTGEEWVGFENIYTVPDLAERDTLPVQKGDVAKVADAGDGAAKSFIFDGEEWTDFYMTGNAGRVTIDAGDAVTLEDDAYLSTENSGGLGPGITSLNAGRLELSGNAFISSTSEAIGDAGTISIHADTDVTLKDDAALTTATLAQGMGGDITVTAKNLEIKDGARISSASQAESGGGDAGSISVHAEDSVKLSGSAALTSEAISGGGGIISVNTEDRLQLTNSQITTSVSQGAGKGGDINIGEPRFVILNQSKISANADQGDGGAIFIITDNYIKSAESSVTATSKRGNDGTVRIEAPDTDISSELVVLPETFFDAARWLKKPCAERTGEKTSSFVIKGRDAATVTFDGWQPSPLMDTSGGSE
ncbi:filamentous hemagglutinin N-terminal domain-containing protein [Desulfobacterales bacterium HSG2]|nr:filamentous hemagglutinin N-terminal domain-containing protein [Desulfobacterales bacterium HSG2]